MVESSSQPKTGGLIDHVRDAPAGSDFYLAIDVAALRGLVPIMLGQMHQTMSPEMKEALDGTAAVEVTANLVTHGPVTIDIEANDATAAQQIVKTITDWKQKAMAQPGPGEPPANNTPVDLAMLQYVERLYQRYQPQLNGTKVTFSIAADDPLQPQLFGLVRRLACRFRVYDEGGSDPSNRRDAPANGSGRRYAGRRRDDAGCSTARRFGRRATRGTGGYHSAE